MRVGGISQLATSLRKLGDTELSEEMKAASKQAASHIVPIAKRMVPVDTGTLQSKIKADATRRYAIIQAGTATQAKYAYRRHRGWGRVKGVPYIRDAITQGFPEIVKEYVKAMNRLAVKFEKKHGICRVYGRYL